MNRKQLQLAVCKELLNESRYCAGTSINEDEFAITTDGCTCFVFAKTECVFNPVKVKNYDGLKQFFEGTETDVEIKKTNQLFFSEGRVIQKYAGENLVVYIDEKVAKPFEGYRYFASSSKGRVLVKDNFDRLIGLFLPVKYSESEDK